MENNKYGFILSELLNKPLECQKYLSRFLNKGHLGLLLGAGASKALELPSWEELVIAITNEIIPDKLSGISGPYTNEQLKKLTSAVKRAISDDVKYLSLVKKHLYEKVNFDFNTANTKLLIALASLIVGKKRGNVQNIITYNFDSVLEWYLKINGLEVNILSKSELLFRTADVYVTHIHGYLPHDPKYGSSSDFLIFSEEDFVDRMLEEDDYWKDHLYEYFRRHVFLSLGLSAESLIKDIAPYLRRLDKWYSKEKISRNMPYGFAFISMTTTDDQQTELLEHGIISCKFEHIDIPQAVFKIAENALSEGRGK